MSHSARPTIFTPAYYAALEAVESHPWVQHIETLQRKLLRRHSVLWPDCDFLDAGCGVGGFALRCLARRETAWAAGLDRSAEAASRASERGLAAMIADAGALPLEAEAFDCVISADVIQHLPEARIAPMLAEFLRVLQPGGTLAIRTSHRKGLGANRHRDAADYRQFDAAELRQILLSHGFVRPQTYRANVLPALAADWRARHQPPPVGDTGLELGEEPASKQLLLRLLWSLERAAILGLRLPMPYGHTLFAFARKPDAQ